MDNTIFFVFLDPLFCYNTNMIEKIKHLPKSFKISLFILVLISGAYVSSWALGYGQNNNSDGLVLDITLSSDYYTAGTKTFSDQSGNNNNGVSANNAVFVPDRDGKSEGAMSFNGSSDYVSAGNSSIYDLQSAGTVSAWVKIPSTWSGNVYPNLVSKGASAGWDTNGWSLYAFSDGRIGIGMRNGSTTSIRDFTNTIKDQWTHIVGIWDGTTIRIYQDGVLKASGSQGVNPGLNTNNVIIGRGPTSYYFGGEVAQVKIYNRAFSAEEVQKLYGDSKPKIQASSLEKGLVGYWPLNGEHYNSNTNRVTDKSAYSNHGTNSGATLTADRFGRSAGAMGFNGSSYISGILDSFEFSKSQTFTTSIWFNIQGVHDVSGSGLVMGIFGSGSHFRSWGIDHHWDGNQLRFGMRDVNGTKIVSVPFSSDNYNLWYNAVLVYDKEIDRIKAYLNGNYIGQTSTGIQGIWDRIDNNIHIAHGDASLGGSSYRMIGSAQDARVYNRALSDAEIKSLYERDAPKISASTLNKGLVGRWDMSADNYNSANNLLSDLTPYNNSAQINNSVSSFSEGGLLKSSLHTSPVFIITHNDNISFSNTDSFSISSWVRIDETEDQNATWIADHHGILWKGVYGNSYGLGLRGGDRLNPSIYAGVRNSSGSFLQYFEADFGELYHVVGTFNASNSLISLYINGELVNSVAYNTSINFANTNNWGALSQGTQYGLGGNPGAAIRGLIGDSRIYNRVLTSTEIKSLYDQGRGQTGIILGGN